MGTQLLLLVVGFALTTVVGGLLGYFFQQRAWSHQHETQLRDGEREQALRTFEEVSTLLDKRLYRMRQLWRATRDAAKAGTRSEQVSTALTGYRDVLIVWNDNLNRILALVQTYFGDGIRRRLEEDLYEDYSAIGRALEDFVRRTSESLPEPIDLPPLPRRLDALGRRVYDLNVAMLDLLQTGHLGRAAPDFRPPSVQPLPLLEFGAQGSAVRRLQQLLNRAGAGQLQVDGGFGRATDTAVRTFQRTHGLPVDGAVGPQTWETLTSQEASEQPS